MLKTLQLEFEIIGYSATTSNNFVNLLSKYEQYEQHNRYMDNKQEKRTFGKTFIQTVIAAAVFTGMLRIIRHPQVAEFL